MLSRRLSMYPTSFFPDISVTLWRKTLRYSALRLSFTVSMHSRGNLRFSTFFRETIVFASLVICAVMVENAIVIPPYILSMWFFGVGIYFGYVKLSSLSYSWWVLFFYGEFAGKEKLVRRKLVGHTHLSYRIVGWISVALSDIFLVRHIGGTMAECATLFRPQFYPMLPSGNVHFSTFFCEIIVFASLKVVGYFL